jgi:hypothetical protein
LALFAEEFDEGQFSRVASVTLGAFQENGFT